MLQSISRGRRTRGVPLLTGALLSAGVSILLWSALLAGWTILR